MIIGAAEGVGAVDGVEGENEAITKKQDAVGILLS